MMEVAEENMEEKIKKAQNAIIGQFQHLGKLERQVRESVVRAEAVRERALAASHVVVGKFYNKERAIEYLQETVKDLSKAQQSSVEAQKLSFEYQKKLAEAVRYCFMMSVQDIAMTRSTIKELEKLLKYEAQEGPSELIQIEIKKLITQLVAREDMLHRLEDSEKKIKKLHERIEQLESRLAD